MPVNLCLNMEMVRSPRLVLLISCAAKCACKLASHHCDWQGHQDWCYLLFLLQSEPVNLHLNMVTGTVTKIWVNV